MMITATELFEDVRDYPDVDAHERFLSLVGLDDLKNRLLKESQILLDPSALEDWSRHFHSTCLPLVEAFRERAPLYVFAGDVGTGKSALAQTFPDAVARQMELPVKLYSLSLSARGTGAVGEMTSLVSAAFAEVRQAGQASLGAGRPSCIHVLLIDEADALAQSREMAQMHHEDRAGVNALIRGIDDLAASKLPVLVVMCTNRPDAIDPAVQRRAAGVFTFSRPNQTQRLSILKNMFEQTGLSDEELTKLAVETGETGERDYGFTYSDLTQRLLPTVVLAAFPDEPISFELVEKLLSTVPPTAPFIGE